MKVKNSNAIRNKRLYNYPNKQSGVSLAILLFIIVILALLSAALVNINSQSTLSNTRQVISTRAFFAAKSGADF